MIERELETRLELDLSAASGLVLHKGIVSVVADDRLAVHRYRLQDGAVLAPLPLTEDAPGRVWAKRDKPDLEALLDPGDGGLLALGSGSRPQRDRGFRVLPNGQHAVVDLAPLYARLRQDLAELNIEGAARQDQTLWLAHRGVGAAGASCLIRVDARALDPDLAQWPAALLRDLRPVDLGTLDGVPLGLTDLACDGSGRLHFLAAAEATDDPYLDGATRGSVFGRIEPDGRAIALLRLRPDVKAEGLAWLAAQRWLLVTDADDPTRRATLYEFDAAV